MVNVSLIKITRVLTSLREKNKSVRLPALPRIKNTKRRRRKILYARKQKAHTHKNTFDTKPASILAWSLFTRSFVCSFHCLSRMLVRSQVKRQKMTEENISRTIEHKTVVRSYCVIVIYHFVWLTCQIKCGSFISFLVFLRFDYLFSPSLCFKMSFWILYLNFVQCIFIFVV